MTPWPQSRGGLPWMRIPRPRQTVRARLPCNTYLHLLPPHIPPLAALWMHMKTAAAAHLEARDLPPLRLRLPLQLQHLACQPLGLIRGLMCSRGGALALSMQFVLQLMWQGRAEASKGERVSSHFLRRCSAGACQQGYWNKHWAWQARRPSAQAMPLITAQPSITPPTAQRPTWRVRAVRLATSCSLLSSFHCHSRSTCGAVVAPRVGRAQHAGLTAANWCSSGLPAVRCGWGWGSLPSPPIIAACQHGSF